MSQSSTSDDSLSVSSVEVQPALVYKNKSYDEGTRKWLQEKRDFPWASPSGSSEASNTSSGSYDSYTLMVVPCGGHETPRKKRKLGPHYDHQNSEEAENNVGNVSLKWLGSLPNSPGNADAIPSKQMPSHQMTQRRNGPPCMTSQALNDTNTCQLNIDKEKALMYKRKSMDVPFATTKMNRKEDLYDLISGRERNQPYEAHVFHKRGVGHLKNSEATHNSQADIDPVDAKIKKVKDLMLELSADGVNGVAVLEDTWAGGKHYCLGKTSLVAKLQNSEVLSDLKDVIFQKSQRASRKQKMKEVQSILNQLYSSAIGSELAKVPYQKIQQGKLVIDLVLKKSSIKTIPLELPSQMPVKLLDKIIKHRTSLSLIIRAGPQDKVCISSKRAWNGGERRRTLLLSRLSSKRTQRVCY